MGNVGLSVTESKAHFSLWCIIMAPLLAGTDIVHMSNEVKIFQKVFQSQRITSQTLAIMTAPEVVAVNQDPLAKQGVRVSPANATGPEVQPSNIQITNSSGTAGLGSATARRISSCCTTK